MSSFRGLGAQRPRNPFAAAEYIPYRLPHPHLYPYEMELTRVLHAAQVREAEQRDTYSCYILGDVGGVVDDRPQRAVAEAMVALQPDLTSYDPEGTPCGGTLFAYIVGDVVYYNGEPDRYDDQFYTPYASYGPPILAIPGNHDGSLPFNPGYESLDGFIANFCDIHAARHTPFRRAPIAQPNVYWTLEAPWLRLIGLYTNVPEGGVIDDEQYRWFQEQIARPLDGKHLVIALHQPVFSADTQHGGSVEMFELIHDLAREAGCRLIISGHSHNYQRFEYQGITYIVAGAGGYYELHNLARREYPGAQYPLVSNTRDYGFTHLTVTPGELTLRAYAVPPSFNARRATPHLIDSMTCRNSCPLSTMHLG